MKDWQNRITSESERPRGSKSAPPLPPPSGMPVSAFLNTCSKPRNLMMLRLTDGWKRRPPLYGPSAELNSTRKPRLMWILPASRSEERRVGKECRVRGGRWCRRERQGWERVERDEG